MAINGIKSFKVTTISLYFLLLRHMAAVAVFFFSSFSRLLLYECNVADLRNGLNAGNCTQNCHWITQKSKCSWMNSTIFVSVSFSLSLSFCVCFASVLQQVVCTCLIRIQNSCESIFIFVWWQQNDSRKWHFTISHSTNHEFRKIIWFYNKWSEQAIKFDRKICTCQQ